jgi:enolase
VLDSRGQPTVEVEIGCDDGASGRAIVPSGASTGAAEAKELRDGDASRYDGKGVRAAVENVRGELQSAVLGFDPSHQQSVDQRLIEADGSADKGRLGGNAVLGVSLAAAHAAAASQRVPLFRHLHEVWKSLYPAAGPPRLPLPMTNMISGGLHAGGNLDFQDFLIQPVGAPNYAMGLEWLCRVAKRLGELLIERGYEGRLLADEGGFGPKLEGPRQAFQFLLNAIERATLQSGRDVTIALDVASTHFP